MNKIVDMQQVSWKRQGKTILSDIDWKVVNGEHWAILGLNGSGKTTLLNMINGYIWPTKGRVNILEKPFGQTDIRELRKSIGWVSSSLQERMKGTERVENIVVSGKFASIGLYENPTEADFAKAYQLLELLHCSHLWGRAYQTCSQGEKQKILITRGLMGSPDLLILDEPTNGLDFISREELMNTINQLAIQKNAPTILFVTHHIEEIMPIFTHTLLLKLGTVYGRGKREEMLTKEYLSCFFDLPVQIDWSNDRAWMTL
ncbi:ABC transporter ATP-binding protein [Lentibacillus sp. Marseille-P4043]|uniref:ABC transporter ATP-binding protein n=1 Tax=Lentibacillus sp. Marseille-P4043 TaxID=2040293 RepID=UPI000D0B4AC8|nr:ABC transporter ATP-binding protein [Lentibacillus sp. Marseille-P4043]